MNKNYGNHRPIQHTDWTISIPTKITDGLFMADHHIAQDKDFFQTNQVTHVINCAGKQLSNTRDVNQVSFLTFQWTQNDIQNITDQNVISVIVNFIQQCRREHGCLLIHSYLSQSRPFCLLACYLMIKFKWNLFKTLQFLNSRKQDIQLQPAFFQQLTNFHQKIQQKGLIKSKNWIISDAMGQQEIILTNTYLNSKKRNIVVQNHKKKPTKKVNVCWKNDLVIQHSYCPNSIIAVNDPYLQSKKVNSLVLTRQRSDSITSKDQKQKKKQQKQIKSNHANILQQKTNSLSEMNVTKKWTQLRQMWMKQKQFNKQKEDFKEKQNQNVQNYNNSLTSQKKQSLIAKKDNQRINDRLQQKLNLLKRYQQKSQVPNNNNKKSKKNLENKQNSIQDTFKPKQNQFNNKCMSEKNSRILHNNWIINKQVIKESMYNQQQAVQNNKQKTNKSVIIVKPNHTGPISNDNGSRTSLRKVTGSQRKPQKQKQDTSVGKFFKNQQILASKGRCNSTKPQRKQSPANGMGLIKNSSYKAKGKWKF